jgi:flagellar FliL protein
MAQEAPTHAAPAEGGSSQVKPERAPNKLLLPLVVALTTIAGAAMGVLVIAPKLIAARSHVAEGLARDSSTGGESETVSENAHGGERGPTFKIDNLIVNPSGSQGTRFLMVSVAVETPNAAMEALLRSREAQIRDLVITMLERQTMESLAQPGIRDTLKAQLSDTITALSGQSSRLRVFLPQFVIQ